MKSIIAAVWHRAPRPGRSADAEPGRRPRTVGRRPAPSGRSQGAGGAPDARRHRRYDLVNRLMTFRLDVRWRRLAVRCWICNRVAGRRPRLRHRGDLCVELARQGLRPVSVDLSFGMLRADRSGAPRVQADILEPPVPDGALDGVTCGFALRNLVGSSVLRRASDERPAGRAHRPARRRHPSERSDPLGSQRVLRQGGAPHRRAAVRSGRYRYLPKSVAYLPPPVEMLGAAPTRLHHRPAAAAVGRHAARHRHEDVSRWA